jgi:hypothetical protein
VGATGMAGAGASAVTGVVPAARTAAGAGGTTCPPSFFSFSFYFILFFGSIYFHVYILF